MASIYYSIFRHIMLCVRAMFYELKYKSRKFRTRFSVLAKAIIETKLKENTIWDIFLFERLSKLWVHVCNDARLMTGAYV